MQDLDSGFVLFLKVLKLEKWRKAAVWNGKSRGASETEMTFQFITVTSDLTRSEGANQKLRTPARIVTKLTVSMAERRMTSIKEVQCKEESCPVE